MRKVVMMCRKQKQSLKNDGEFLSSIAPETGLTD